MSGSKSVTVMACILHVRTSKQKHVGGKHNPRCKSDMLSSSSTEYYLHTLVISHDKSLLE